MLSFWTKSSQKIFSKQLPFFAFSQKSNPQTQLAKLQHFTEPQLKILLSQPNELRDIMVDEIQNTGEMKLDKYWRMALTHEKYGYYCRKNAFSKEGDFTTSPEISSLFGEMVAIWLINFLQSQGLVSKVSNKIEKPFRIIQLGPGRGVLMQDILKIFFQLKVDNNFELNFIEVSDLNKKEQQKTILDEFKHKKLFFKFEHEKANKSIEQFTCEDQKKNIKLNWFSCLEDIIKKDHEDLKNKKELPFTIFVMNEFFDALPVTVMQFTEVGWRQKVIKLSRNPQMVLELRNSVKTPPEILIPTISEPKIGEVVEISPEGLIAIDAMAKMIKISGGAIINFDYGDQSFFTNSVRAIKEHKYIQSPYFWQLPGLCDLSAYVNFSALAHFAQKNEGIEAMSLLNQGFFLQCMGINKRIELVTQGKKKEICDRIESEYQRLTGVDQMGQIYKTQIITLKKYRTVFPFRYEEN